MSRGARGLLPEHVLVVEERLAWVSPGDGRSADAGRGATP